MNEEGLKPMELPQMDASEIRRKFPDVPYASESPSQMLDIYLPDEGEGPFPTIVFLHGGAFVGGRKNDMQTSLVIDGLNRGYAVVSVEQRLAGEKGVFPYPLFDFKAALRFLRANADAYMLDGRRFASAGASAGAYHAVMAAATQHIPQFEDPAMGNPEQSSKVQAVVGLFGVYDLVMQSEFTQAQGPMPGAERVFDFAEVFAGVKPAEHPGLMYFTNPIHWVTPEMPPTLLQAGDADQIVPFAASAALAERIKVVCGADRIQFDVAEGGAHGDPVFHGEDYQARLFAFLDARLKKL
jgi:acetyl esterase/lipase